MINSNYSIIPIPPSSGTLNNSDLPYDPSVPSSRVLNNPAVSNRSIRSDNDSLFKRSELNFYSVNRAPFSLELDTLGRLRYARNSTYPEA